MINVRIRIGRICVESCTCEQVDKSKNVFKENLIDLSNPSEQVANFRHPTVIINLN